MSNQSIPNNNIIIGLKTQVKRQAGLKKFNERVLDHTEGALLQAWLELNRVGVDITPLVWAYIEKGNFSLFKNIDSKLVGIKTVVKDYTDKKGITKLAHFTQNDKYYGSIKVYGKEPVYYQGNFKVTRYLFKVQVDAQEKTLEDLFKPINQ